MPLIVFSPNIKARSADVNANFSGLADGSLIDAGAITNAKLNTAEGELGGAWTSWTPSYTNITVGNGDVEAKYLQIGKTVFYRYSLNFGSTSSIGTSPKLSLPVATLDLSTYDINGIVYGNATYRNSAGRRVGVVTVESTTEVRLLCFTDVSTEEKTLSLSATVPFTWTTGDDISITGFYEAA